MPAGPFETPHEAKHEDTTSPPALHYPPASAEVSASGIELSNGSGQSTPSSRAGGSVNGLVRPPVEQLLVVATSVHLIEKNIPHVSGQRRCTMCGYVNLLRSSLLLY